MHEMSIVQALVKQCEEIAKKNNAKKIAAVHLKIGVLSGIEPHFLETTFHTFKEHTICDEAKLFMNIQNIEVICQKCKKQSVLVKYEFICPECQSTDLKVIDGEDMILMRLEME